CLGYIHLDVILSRGLLAPPLLSVNCGLLLFGFTFLNHLLNVLGHTNAGFIAFRSIDTVIGVVQIRSFFRAGNGFFYFIFHLSSSIKSLYHSSSIWSISLQPPFSILR